MNSQRHHHHVTVVLFRGVGIAIILCVSHALFLPGLDGLLLSKASRSMAMLASRAVAGISNLCSESSLLLGVAAGCWNRRSTRVRSHDNRGAQVRVLSAANLVEH